MRLADIESAAPRAAYALQLSDDVGFTNRRSSLLLVDRHLTGAWSPCNLKPSNLDTN